MSYDDEYISYDELAGKINLIAQGIMPTSGVQRWYNDDRSHVGKCVKLLHDSERTNPPDTRMVFIRSVSDLNRLTPRRRYEISIFPDTDFEERYLYMGAPTTEHGRGFIPSSDSDSDSDAHTISDGDDDSDSDSDSDSD